MNISSFLGRSINYFLKFKNKIFIRNALKICKKNEWKSCGYIIHSVEIV